MQLISTRSLEACKDSRKERWEKMSIGAVQHGYRYQNTYGNYTHNMPAPVCQSKMKNLGDEFIMTERKDGDNDVYRNASMGASTSATVKGYCSGVVDLSLLVYGTNENNRFIGSLSSDSDVDYLKIDTRSQFLSRRPVSITMKVPEGCDYNMSIYDKEGNQVGQATDNGDGTKTIKVPCDWSNSKDFILKIEKADGSVVKPDENYTLTFAQGDKPEEVVKELEKAQERNGSELQDGEKKLLASLAEKDMREKLNYEGLARLHKEQFDALPKELQYAGDESAEQMLVRKRNGETLTAAEEAYVKIYGNINDIQKIEANEADQRFQSDFNAALQETGISSDSTMHISISSTGEVNVTGLSDEDNEKVKKLVEEKFMQQIKNFYLNNSETIENMNDNEYRLAGYVEELDRFVGKASNGKTTVDDLGITSVEGVYSSVNNSISGLPGNVADLVNNADAVSKYYDYKQMIYDVLTYKKDNGTIPRYKVQMDVNGGAFDFA